MGGLGQIEGTPNQVAVLLVEKHALAKGAQAYFM